MKKLLFNRLVCLAMLLLLCKEKVNSQQRAEENSLDPLYYGVVLDDPAMKQVQVKKDLTYFKDDKRDLHIDIYSPPNLSAHALKPAIVFLNAIGDRPGQAKVKSWGIYSSWPKLMAAYGYIGISMEADGANVQESIRSLFDFLAKKGPEYHIDPQKLGVYAASANVSGSMSYLMSKKVSPGIKAAVLYYGGTPNGPFRKDLPVLFVVSEGDAARNGYGSLWNEVLRNNAPWTIMMGTGMPHAFDAYSDNDQARRIIKETIAFWKIQLDPMPTPAFPHSNMRDVFGLLRMDPAKALGILESMVSEQPNNTRILSFYANALRETNHPDQAMAVYQKMNGLEPGNPQVLVDMACVAYGQNNNETADKYVAAAIQTGKMTAGLYGDLGYRLLANGKDHEAATYYEKALALQPNIHDYYNLACAYAKAGEKDNAFAAMDKAIALGFGSRQQVEQDNDFVSIRSDDRYKALLEKLN